MRMTLLAWAAAATISTQAHAQENTLKMQDDALAWAGKMLPSALNGPEARLLDDGRYALVALGQVSVLLSTEDGRTLATAPIAGLEEAGLFFAPIVSLASAGKFVDWNRHYSVEEATEGLTASMDDTTATANFLDWTLNIATRPTVSIKEYEGVLIPDLSLQSQAAGYEAACRAEGKANLARAKLMDFANLSAGQKMLGSQLGTDQVVADQIRRHFLEQGVPFDQLDVKVSAFRKEAKERKQRMDGMAAAETRRRMTMDPNGRDPWDLPEGITPYEPVPPEPSLYAPVLDPVSFAVAGLAAGVAAAATGEATRAFTSAMAAEIGESLLLHFGEKGLEAAKEFDAQDVYRRTQNAFMCQPGMSGNPYCK